MSMKDVKKIVIHGGQFHADDVLCVALVKNFINPLVEIQRVFKVTEDMVSSETIVCDIGGVLDPEKLMFDHHQLDGQTSEETAVCAAELLWNFISKELKLSSEFRGISELCREISLHDCGIKFSELSKVVKDFNPLWNEKDTANETFRVAVSFMSRIIERKIDEQLSKDKARDLFEQAPVINGVKVFDTFIPWQDYAMEQGINYAIFPGREEGSYNLSCIRGVNLPSEWLQSKPEGCTFVHQGLFIAAFSNKESAIKATEAL